MLIIRAGKVLTSQLSPSQFKAGQEILGHVQVYLDQVGKDWLN
jgi:hypothetical protein